MENMNVEEFKQAIEDPQVYLVDVRQPEEYSEGHIKGAHNLDVTNPDFKKLAEATLPKDKKIAVYCKSGKRSAEASKELTELGFNVLNLEHGITSWIEAGLPTEK